MAKKGDKLRRWTREERYYLINNYKKKKIKDIAKHLGRTEGAVVDKAKKIGVWKQRKWKKKEVDYLRDYVGEKDVKDIAKQLVRSVASIRFMVHKLGLRKNECNEFPVYIAAELIGVSDLFLYSNIKAGKLIAEQAKIGRREYALTKENLRDFVLDHYPFKIFGCVECGKTVKGDIYCQKHLPALSRKNNLSKCFSDPFRIESLDEIKGVVDFLVKYTNNNYIILSNRIGITPAWLNRYLRKGIFKADIFAGVLSGVGYKGKIYFDGNPVELGHGFEQKMIEIVIKTREKYNLTQDELSVKMNKRKRWIQAFEEGKAIVSLKKIKEICDGFEIPFVLEIKKK